MLAFVHAAGQRVCAGCAGEEPTFRCASCGREDDPYGARCGSCTLRERATELLSDPSSGQIHAEPVPVFDALMAADRTRAPSTGCAALPETVRDCSAPWPAARSRQPRDLRQAPLDQGLPRRPGPPGGPRCPSSLRGTHRADGPLVGRRVGHAAAGHANLVERFARWRVLRQVRHGPPGRADQRGDPGRPHQNQGHHRPARLAR